jgi:hypothetical protein
MLQQKFKNPLSLVGFLVIALVFPLVHFTTPEIQISGWTFLLCLLIFLAGIGFIRKTLLLWFSDFTVMITLLVLAFGTNIFCLVSLDFHLQPLLLFSLYALAVSLTVSWHKNQKVIYSVSLAFASGLIILLQPTGFLFILVPFLWGVHDRASWKSKIQLLKSNFRQVGLFLLIVLIIGLSPFIIWKVSPGEVPFLSFQLPGIFVAFSSWLWNDLFSYDHGWFIYTPVMVFAFIGFYFFAGKYRPFFYAVFLYCILDLFLESSWSKLGSTPVFGQVAFIPSYALLVIPMASFISFILKNRNVRGVLLSLTIAFFIYLNIFQSWQFHKGILLKSGMNADSYSLVFGRTSITESEKAQMEGIEPDATLVFKDESTFRKTDLVFYDFENPDIHTNYKLEKENVKSGKMALVMDSTLRYSPGLEMRYDEFMKKPRIGVRMTASVFAVNAVTMSEGNLVISSVHEGNHYRYKRLNFGDLKLKPGMWNTVSLDYLVPEDPYPGDKLFAYLWYTGTSRIYVDDIKIEAFERK